MKTFNLIMLALLGASIIACQDSNEPELGLDIPEDVENYEVVSENIVFESEVYTLQSYMQGDTVKTFVKDEDFISLESALGNRTELRPFHLVIDETGNSTFYVFNTVQELEASPLYRQMEALESQELANGRTQVTELYTRGYDLTNYGGKIRYCAITNGFNFPDIDNVCQLGCVTAVCKKNDISSLIINNPTTIIRSVRFYDKTNYGGSSFLVSAYPGVTRLLPDLNSIPGVSGNWRNKISSIKQGV